MTAIGHLRFLVRTPEDVHNLEQAFLGLARRGKLLKMESAPGSLAAELTARDIPIETDGPWDSPTGWCWVRLTHLAECVLGKMLDKAKNKGELHPYLGNTHVRWFHFDLTNLKEMRFEATEYERYTLLPGDVVVCEGGEAGRAAVWSADGVDMRIQKALHRVRCDTDFLRPDWLAYVLRCYANDGTLKSAFTGIGIPHLTGASLRRVLIPLPPRKEQDEIVERLKVAYEKLDRLNRAVAEAIPA